MTVRLVVCCDADPAEYAREAGERCRGWLPVGRLLDAVAQGWTSTPQGGDRCPACTRAAHARARAQETHP